MLRNKKSRRKSNQRGSLVTILIFLMVLLLFWLSWGFVQQLMDHDEDLADRFEPLPLRITSPAEFSRESARFNEDDVPNPELLELLFPGSFTLLVDGEDLNGDGSLNFLLITVSETEVPAGLTDLGYGRIISEAQLLSQQADGTLSLLLSITPEAISGSAGSPLVGQIPANYGYGFSFSMHEAPPYEAPVMLFELVILDDELLPASDDLTIYWHPGRQAYAATNAFGAPGTF